MARLKWMKPSKRSRAVVVYVRDSYITALTMMGNPSKTCLVRVSNARGSILLNGGLKNKTLEQGQMFLTNWLRKHGYLNRKKGNRRQRKPTRHGLRQATFFR